MMNDQEERWYKEYGTSAEQDLVAKLAARPVTAGGLLRSVGFFAGLTFVLLCVAAGYLYASRVSYLRPVTGVWVGMMTSSEGPPSKRAIMVDTWVNPIGVSAPAVRGTVRMCGLDGETSFDVQRTATVSADTLGVVLGRADAKTAGELFGALRDGRLAAVYDAVTPNLSGNLGRGDGETYRQACATLRQRNVRTIRPTDSI